MTIEIWKQIDDFPDYAVSNFGRVMRIAPRPSNGGTRTKPGKILKLHPNRRNEYLQVNLYRDKKMTTKRVNRLVADAFLPPPTDEQTDCAHNDGNRQNNHVSNLRWTTHRENCGERQKHKLEREGIRV